MAVQIPLTWQLTDFLCALGLGALYGAVYRWGGMLLPSGRLRGRARKLLSGAGELLWTLAAALFTRAWVLTGSRAAQLRGTSVLGVFLGLAAFYAGVTPALKKLDALLWRLLLPLRRLLALVGRTAAAVRTRYLQAAQKRQTARAARRESRRVKRTVKTAEGEKHIAEKSQKNFPGNAKKELQSSRKMYYNDL